MPIDMLAVIDYTTATFNKWGRDGSNRPTPCHRKGLLPVNAQFTTDAAVIAKWAAAQDDGNAPALTVAELDRLIALTPANNAVALADLADARAIEVEISGDPNASDDSDNTCFACQGTGEGLSDYAPCAMCNGRGWLGTDAMGDEDRDLAWLDEYAVQVQADEWAVA